MSQTLKPLIFVEPLSQTLQKLKEVIEENAESEGIEVYDVEDINELAQLVANVGQSLVLTASPKKCAVFLQSSRKVIKAIQTKTILLSPKSIPRKTLDKFMKVGLTECVVEPVNPKTLLYKVRLQLRSIIAKTDEEQQEMTSRFSQEDSTATPEDKNQKLRAEKGVILDDEENPEVQLRDKKEQQEEIIEDPRKRKNTYQEEAIDAYYKGNTKKNQEEISYDEEGRPKKKYQEEAIDAHYKGKLKKEDNIEEEEVEKKKKTNLEFLDDTESLDDVRKRLELEAEENFAREVEQRMLEEEQEKVRKKALGLAVEEDVTKEQKEKGEVEDLGGHYKGKIKKSLEIEDDEYHDEKEKQENLNEVKEKKKKANLLLVEEEKDFLDKKDDDDSPEVLEKKKKAKLELLDENDPDFLDKKEAIEEEFKEKKKKAQLKLEEVHEKEKLERPKEESQEKEREKRDAKADHIDGYLRGGAAKKDLELEAEEDLYKDEKRELEHEEKRKKKEALLLEDDDAEKDPLHAEKEYDEDLNKKKKAEKLLLDDDSDYGNKKAAKKEDLDDRERRKSNYREDDQDGYSKGKGAGPLKDDKGFGNRADARADKIKTHYSSKESLKHGEQDWDAKWEKKEKEQQDFEPLARGEKELIIEKEDLGEQTIDYGQLKKEFENISIDGVSNKKKEYGIIDNVIKPKTYKKRVASLEGQLEEMEFEEVIEQEIEVEGEKVFEPDSLGMEIAIEVLEFYFSKDADSLSLCKFLNDRVQKAFHGQIVFYSFAHSEFPEPLFNGLIHAQTGDEPTPLPASELEGYSRSEQKELENDYKAELAEFNKSLKEAKTQWQEKYHSLLSDWREFKTPDWKDHTFQEEENHFVFPFYEGVTLMGLAVFIPTSEFVPSQSDALEAVFEVARGIFITEYHEKKGAGQIREAKKKEEPQKKGGLFGKLFGKAS